MPHLMRYLWIPAFYAVAQGNQNHKKAQIEFEIEIPHSDETKSVILSESQWLKIICNTLLSRDDNSLDLYIKLELKLELPNGKN